ncbi:NAD-dependent succinate-semialdehyde dehydrogenase [Gordonia sp. zg691]|uniref:NAD-dependent succinate-semialdehyde dehydrogenase n=1 Tax=Gordonia jinghuaiqii TaxID=2758710 RepID=A0A7D7RRN5_9ACTN|nr:NAD-dependent succinate-semialdehyde dehydrogenase [Gordonia jinghuaiqii]MBD0861951.1 NAD-dependent succinate-semialdehyde dehydrogenase [Gordonia jinghuaiqii]MCR5977856.1 aldehyde dehydrogenase family protein [Gordonia jinghuaiqii]QMT02513.1 NAD-dependent succinate-semialdehyde dehydrogenase [Gordonia jinghuaiqii]
MTGWAGSELLGHLETGIHVGHWRSPAEPRTLAVTSPATGAEIATVADAREADARAALDTAVAAMAGWSATSPIARADLLMAAYARVLEVADDLAVVICAETGKTLAEAKGEVAYGAQYLRWYAEEAVRLGGRIATSPDGSTDIVVERGPVGPCLLITPWNFPFAMVTRKVAPALAAGNTVILKPSELTPLSAYVLVHVLLEVGVPAGVVSLLTTTRPAEISEPLLSDARLRKVSFTGSTGVGRLLHEQASAHFAKTSLELGGDAPLLVFDDADVDRAVEGIMLAKFRNSGQSCVAANRIYLQRSIAGPVVDKLAERIDALRVDDGFADGADVGAVIDERAQAKCAQIVDTAVAAGGTVRARSSVPSTGSFVPATLVVDVPLESPLRDQEIFGPIAIVSIFDDEDEVISAANNTSYGLASYVFTQDIDRASRVGRAIDAGMVGINTGLISNVAAPFGGVKDSGVGREGGAEGIEEYQNLRYLSVVRGR